MQNEIIWVLRRYVRDFVREGRTQRGGVRSPPDPFLSFSFSLFLKMRTRQKVLIFFLSLRGFTVGIFNRLYCHHERIRGGGTAKRKNGKAGRSNSDFFRKFEAKERGKVGEVGCGRKQQVRGCEGMPI